MAFRTVADDGKWMWKNIDVSVIMLSVCCLLQRKPSECGSHCTCIVFFLHCARRSFSLARQSSIPFNPSSCARHATQRQSDKSNLFLMRILCFSSVWHNVFCPCYHPYPGYHCLQAQISPWLKTTFNSAKTLEKRRAEQKMMRTFPKRKWRRQRRRRRWRLNSMSVSRTLLVALLLSLHVVPLGD